MKKYEHLIYSAIGLVALFLLLVAVNFLVARAPLRADLTEGDLYTLSPGTRKILANLQSPVKVKLYLSQGETVPVQLRSFAQRVEDLVREFKSVAGSNLVVERYNPKPDSDEEELLLDYGMHQRRLLPLLAKTYALHFSQEVLVNEHDETLTLKQRAAFWR